MLTKDEAHRFAEHRVAAWNAHDLDRILSHYEADAELISPVAAHLLNDPQGRVVGRAVMWGVKSIVLYYANQRGTHTGEYMELSPRGKVVRVVANYSG